jgi:hypothetical protein
MQNKRPAALVPRDKRLELLRTKAHDRNTSEEHLLELFWRTVCFDGELTTSVGRWATAFWAIRHRRDALEKIFSMYGDFVRDLVSVGSPFVVIQDRDSRL